MKFLFLSMLLFSQFILAKEQSPENFVKVEMEKMLNGEEISLLRTTNDYYPTIFVAETFTVKKVAATQSKKQIKYFKTVVTFDVKEKIEQDPVHQQQQKIKAKIEKKEEKLDLTFYFKKEGQRFIWTTQLEELFVHKDKSSLFLK